ncbi:MAG: N-acetyl sugar amidotransferase [bacterium]|nr:N-acetyl sugar amidotransferase [bacterium]
MITKKLILDQQLKSQSKEVKYCVKCVLSNQRPKVTFDENGVCSACQYAWRKYNLINWEKRHKELLRLCEKYRSKNKSYDVIVPSSGGKDSSIVAYKLKYEYGMHPLTVTWAPFLYTDIGWKNYINFKDSGFDNILCFPNGNLHRKLSRVAFEVKGDNFEPFVWGQKALAFNIAVKFKIPLIFYGENGEVEYSGHKETENKPFESPADWEKMYLKGSGPDKIIQAGLKIGVLNKKDIGSTDFSIYKPPSMKDIKKLGIQMHWFSYYNKWIPQENFYFAQKHTGFTVNEEGRSEGTYSKYASLDDKTDGIHYYMAFIKFGLGRCTSDAAHEIRDGHITREEGVALVKRYDGEFPKKHFQETLEYLNLTEKEFWKIVNKFRPSHLWKKEKGEWKLKYQVK